jgi:HEAT repeat protein
MQFLADVFVPCDQCDGKRFKPQVLDVKYRGRNVDQVLEMTVREALTFFAARPRWLRRLHVLDEIGLGYLRLGQPATTLSGGRGAARQDRGPPGVEEGGERLLYILDEPTTGLHFDDIAKLLAAFRKLLQAGHTLLVIEHNLDVLKTADHIIDLGPEGGEEGGYIVAGTACVCILVTFVVFVVQARDPRAAQPAVADIVSRLGDPDARVRLQAIDEVLAMYLAEDLDSRARKALVPEPAGLTRAQRAFAGAPFSVWPGSPAPELTAALLRALSDSDRQVRLDAAYTVGAIARPPLSSEDTTRLLVGLGHADAPTRAAAARVIGRLQVQQGGDALVTAMNDPDDDVRVGAMWALGELRFDRGVQALTGFSTYYGRGALGLAALDALARIAHPSSAPLFREALLDRNPVVRRRAAEALGRAGDRPCDPAPGRGGDVGPGPSGPRRGAVRPRQARPSLRRRAGLAARRPAGVAAARSYLVEIAEPARWSRGCRIRTPACAGRPPTCSAWSARARRSPALTALREDPIRTRAKPPSARSSASRCGASRPLPDGPGCPTPADPSGAAAGVLRAADTRPSPTT